MNDPYNLQRFIDAQKDVFAAAYAELARAATYALNRYAEGQTMPDLATAT